MPTELTLEAVWACVSGKWAAKVGDPSIGGWSVAFAYGIASALACFVALRGREGQDRIFWGVVGIALAFLAFNKQLDLQSAFTQVGRCVAQIEGWYEARRGFQRRFIYGLGALGLLAALFLAWRLRRNLDFNWLALAGFYLIMVYVVVRAVSMHHMDALIGEGFGDVAASIWVELAGAVMIAINAGWLLARRRRRVRRDRPSAD